jgi:hypothetical protein
MTTLEIVIGAWEPSGRTFVGMIVAGVLMVVWLSAMLTGG